MKRIVFGIVIFIAGFLGFACASPKEQVFKENIAAVSFICSEVEIIVLKSTDDFVRLSYETPSPEKPDVIVSGDKLVIKYENGEGGMMNILEGDEDGIYAITPSFRVNLALPDKILNRFVVKCDIVKLHGQDLRCKRLEVEGKSIANLAISGIFEDVILNGTNVYAQIQSSSDGKKLDFYSDGGTLLTNCNFQNVALKGANIYGELVFTKMPQQLGVNISHTALIFRLPENAGFSVTSSNDSNCKIKSQFPLNANNIYQKPQSKIKVKASSGSIMIKRNI